MTSALPVRCAGLFAILGRDFDQILRQTISVRRKALLKNTNLLASRHIKRGNTSSPTDKRSGYEISYRYHHFLPK